MTGRNTRPPRPLTALQQAILDLVWSRGTVTADALREALLPKHRLKDSSVRTLLRRLEERGFLTHTSDGKTFLYRARVGPRSVAARSVRELIDRFWSGSTEQFLVGMVDEEILSTEEIQQLARKVARARSKGR